MNYFLDVIQNKYADFNGRARRKEFWMFALISIIVSLALNALGALGGESALGSIGRFLGGIYGLAVLIPSIAVGVRRLHYVGKSGWMIILGFIPVVNLYVLYLLVLDSNSGDNEYGPNPKGM